MESNLWSKVKWILSVWRDLKKYRSWKSVVGTKLIFGAISAVPIFGVLLPALMALIVDTINIELTYGRVGPILPILIALTFILGVFLIIYDIWQESKTAKNVAKVIINGLPDTPIQFPNDVLTKSEQRLARDPIELSFSDENIRNQVDRYNAEVCVELFKRFVLHHRCEKLYIGGLARIPFLVAYGKFLRNVSNIYYFDKVHRDSKWRLLDDEDTNIGLNLPIYLPEANAVGDIGIALGFSTVISRHHIPEELRDCTAFIEPTLSTGRNLVLNQDNLQRLSDELRSTIDRFSAQIDVKRIHFFLAIQSSFAIELGRKYQEGVHKPWIIHNFTADSGKYEWALQLTKLGVEIVERGK